MIKEIFLAILLVIVSLTNVYTGDVFTPEVKENPAPMFADGLTERDIATTYEIGKTVNNKAIPEEEILEAWEKNRMVGLWLADMVRKENIQ